MKRGILSAGGSEHLLLTFSPENPVKVVSGNTIGQCLDWLAKKEKYEQSLQCKLFYVKTCGQFIHSLEKDLGQVESSTYCW